MSLIEQLIRRKEDRGLMASLRCFLVESKRQRAWPALNRLNVRIDDVDAGTVAALFATHSEVAAVGNMGDHCRTLEKLRNEKRTDDAKLTPTERRFQHLLAANRSEIHERVGALIRMAKQQGVAINYEQLLIDLRYWNERTRNDWATHFWTPNVAQKEEEA